MSDRQLEKAITKVQQTYAQFDTFGTTHPVLHCYDDVASLNAILKAARMHQELCKVMETIAKQPLTKEIGEEDVDYADFEGAYDYIIEQCREVMGYEQ